MNDKISVQVGTGFKEILPVSGHEREEQKNASGLVASPEAKLKSFQISQILRFLIKYVK